MYNAVKWCRNTDRVFKRARRDVYKRQTQWGALKAYANEKGIEIIGDIPIYVAFDSADSWSHPELFQFEMCIRDRSRGCQSRKDSFS